MRSQYLVLLIALLGIFTACTEDNGLAKTVTGSGRVITEERKVDGFTAVSLQGIGQLIIDQTGTESLSISADDNLLPYIESRVQGNKLIISVKENIIFNHVTELVFHVTVAAIDRVELDGAGSMAISHLNVDSWRVNLAGTGSITTSGQARSQTVEIDGAGSYTADELASQEVTVRHSGVGMVVVQVSDRLDVRIDGLGTVEYIGDPDVTQTINGLGTVRQR